MDAPSYPYLFICGSIAICAMILPGISGAMISIVLGVYFYMMKIPLDLLHGNNVARGLASIAVFGAGCVISLILFSKLLRWLLSHYSPQTMAVLCGFMFGALRNLWPFQEFLGKHQFELVMPVAVDGRVVAVVAVGLVAFILVLIVDRCARRREHAILPTTTRKLATKRH